MKSTAEREAYFLDFVPDIAGVAKMPVMVTGGVTRRATAERVVATPGVDMVGVARALAIRPDLPDVWARGEDPEIELHLPRWKNRGLGSLAGMSMAKRNLDRLGRGKPADPKPGPVTSLLRDQFQRAWKTRRYRKWLETQET